MTTNTNLSDAFINLTLAKIIDESRAKMVSAAINVGNNASGHANAHPVAWAAREALVASVQHAITETGARLVARDTMLQRDVKADVIKAGAQQTAEGLIEDMQRHINNLSENLPSMVARAFEEATKAAADAKALLATA